MTTFPPQCRTGSALFTSSAEPPTADARAAQIRGEVATRLGAVCGHLAPEQFERLVEDVTRFTLRWSRGEGPAR